MSGGRIDQYVRYREPAALVLAGLLVKVTIERIDAAEKACSVMVPAEALKSVAGG